MRRKTIAKRMRAKLKRSARTEAKEYACPISIARAVAPVCGPGAFNYYASPGNCRALDAFRTQVVRMLARRLCAGAARKGET